MQGKRIKFLGKFVSIPDIVCYVNLQRRGTVYEHLRMHQAGTVYQ